MDVTNPSLNKLPTFAKLGIRELWWHREGKMLPFALREDKYVEQDERVAFPNLTGTILDRFVGESSSLPRHKWSDSVREWARHNKDMKG